MRSQSTDKQSQNFIAKLENKVSQLTGVQGGNIASQDDSGMMRGANNNSKSPIQQHQFKKVSGGIMMGGAGGGRFNNSNFGNSQHVMLPKTGIEQPFMRDRPRFKETHKEFEPIH